MDGLLLGVDIGTGSTKGVITTPSGDVVATATRSHRMSMPRSGWAEMDAERDWWGDAAAVISELSQRVPADTVVGVCVSGLGPCVLLADAEARPLRPAVLYGIDTRAAQEIIEIDQRYGSTPILERCGKALSSQAVGPKLLWLRRHEPAVWRQARRWYSAHSFVLARLTGEFVLDHHTASQCDPLYDLKNAEWYGPWYDDLAGHLERPRLAWPGEIVGTVSAEAAAQTGLPIDTPVCAGTVDAWAEAFSAGIRQPGELMLMYGSTMFFIQEVPKPSPCPGLWTTAGVVPGSWTLAAGMSTSGSLTEWVRHLTGDPPYETLVAEAAATSPGADGLIILPYFAGERTPIYDSKARGVIAGLTLRHGRGHLFRAVYEGIAYGVRQIIEELERAGGPAQRIVAVGGGTQGGLWTQIVSDVTGKEQDVPRTAIGACYGDALLAALGIHGVPPGTNWARYERRIVPEPAHAQVYDELYQIYRSLYPSTRDEVHRLATFQQDHR
jgi:xylulokinase